MELYRSVIEELKAWKSRKDRKPLVMRGARQTGKTWMLKYFGNTEYIHLAYFNFDDDDTLKDVFQRTKDPKRIIEELKLHTDAPINPDDTLIVFDEIQGCNKALNTLKYFCEDAPEYHVVAAGSLLGVTLSKGDSFPVGKVEFCDMYPLTFKEFLMTADSKICHYIDTMETVTALPEIISVKLEEYYRQYIITGGMPAAVKAFLEGKSMTDVDRELNFILSAYSNDFSKHADGRDVPRIINIWNSIPSQLAKENRKFIYKLVRPGARAREYEDALLWMNSAGLLYRVFCCTKPNIPIKAYDDVASFKIYMCDVGLLRRLASLPPEVVLNGNGTYVEFKGAIAENYILQSLVTQYDVKPRYWTSVGKAEVDFVIQHGTNVIPIDVKSGTRLTGKSLYIYDGLYHPQLKIRFSLNGLKRDDNLLNIPLYLADWTKQIVSKELMSRDKFPQ